MYETQSSARRTTSIPHLVIGLIFLGIAGMWALAATGAVDYDGEKWVLPLVLVIAGAVGLLISLGGAFRSSRTRDTTDEEDTSPLL